MADRIRHGYEEVKILLGTTATLPPLEAITENLIELAQPLLPLIGDAQDHLLEGLEKGRAILFEGAQATLLDIDHGTYPYVTVLQLRHRRPVRRHRAAPQGPRPRAGRRQGLHHPGGRRALPHRAAGRHRRALREMGHEFGTTTGRPRRCGWFDAVIARHAAAGPTGGRPGHHEAGRPGRLRRRWAWWSATGTAKAETLDSLPACAADWTELKPEVKTFKGWDAPTRGITDPTDLPAEARAYLAALCDQAEAPLAYLSTGPDRNEGFVPAGSILEPLLG